LYVITSNYFIIYIGSILVTFQPVTVIFTLLNPTLHVSAVHITVQRTRKGRFRCHQQNINAATECSLHNVIILRGKQRDPLPCLSFSTGYLASTSKNLNKYIRDTQPIA